MNPCAHKNLQWLGVQYAADDNTIWGHMYNCMDCKTTVMYEDACPQCHSPMDGRLRICECGYCDSDCNDFDYMNDETGGPLWITIN